MCCVAQNNEHMQHHEYIYRKNNVTIFHAYLFDSVIFNLNGTKFTIEVPPLKGDHSLRVKEILNTILER